MATQDTAIRKRQQIANANRMMFLWVAGASVLVGIGLVTCLFLFQKAVYNEKVLSQKSKTASILVANNKTIDELKSQIRVLNTNQALKDSMIAGETQPVQVVLDALPSQANSSALGASLQEKFLNDPALTIETLNVDPVQGVESQEPGSVVDASASSDQSQPQITFRFVVSAGTTNVGALKNLLQRLERSIRAIDITSLTIETQANKVLLTAQGHAFYGPAKTVELKEKVVKP